MRNILSFTIALLILGFISCEQNIPANTEDEKSNSQTQQQTKLVNTEYGGCFEDTLRESIVMKGDSDPTENVYTSFEGDKLHFHIILPYICCINFIDSVNVEGDAVQIYIEDTCKGDDCGCRCMCNYELDYTFEDYNTNERIDFNVFLKDNKSEDYKPWESKTVVIE